MELNVTRLNHGLLPPSEPTPSGVLGLSVIDRHPGILNFKAEIECSGEDIWLVEACADRSLEEMKHFENAKCVPIDKLLPTHPDEADGLDPLVLMQITKFRCNGFAQFLKVMGEMALGEDKPSITPCWSRDLIQSPSLETYLSTFPKIPLPPPTPTYQLEDATIDIPLNFMNRQKEMKACIAPPLKS